MACTVIIMGVANYIIYNGMYNIIPLRSILETLGYIFITLVSPFLHTLNNLRLSLGKTLKKICVF